MKEKPPHATAARLFHAAKTLMGVDKPSEIARLLNVSDQRITNWSRRGVSREGMLLAQRIIGCSVTWLESGEGLMSVAVSKHISTSNELLKTSTKSALITAQPSDLRNTLGELNIEPGPDKKGEYPLISWVQAGAWEQIVDNFAPGDAEDWFDSPVKVSSSSFYLRVRGESMYDPADHRSFRDGEIILVDPEANAENGSNVIVRLDDESEATFKQLVIEGEKKYLKALNPTWPNRIFEVNGNATICGVVKTKIVQY